MQGDKKIDALLERFGAFDDWEERYAELIKFGKEFPELDEKFQVDKFKVNGCQSQVWLYPQLKAGKLQLSAASDAVLVKGIISLLVHVYTDRSPEEILQLKPDFLDQLGIREHLSMNRSNGIMHMLKKIQTYALLFQSLVAKGINDVDEI
tara:strand:- start:4719 stop:5168 length:450 start_codon:yes stop_codon:yes gene_type:complete